MVQIKEHKMQLLSEQDILDIYIRCGDDLAGARGIERAVLTKLAKPPKMVTPYITQEHFDRAFPDTPLDHFREGQWWVQELDAMVKGASSDQRRAVAVVHNLLRAIHRQKGDPESEVKA